MLLLKYDMVAVGDAQLGVGGCLLEVGCDFRIAILSLRAGSGLVNDVQRDAFTHVPNATLLRYLEVK